MDRFKELVEHYTEFANSILPQNIVPIVCQIIKNENKLSVEIVSEQIVQKLPVYFSLIESDLGKYVAYQRIQNDIANTRKVHDLILKKDLGIKGFDNFEFHKIKINVDKSEKNWNDIHNISKILLLTIQLEITELFSDFEFELIGATPPPRKTKPTNETRLALTQNELMYLFMKLASENLFTSSDKMHLARGIDSLSQFSVKQTREKGQNLKLKELENIKMVIDKISTSLQKDIDKGGV